MTADSNPDAVLQTMLLVVTLLFFCMASSWILIKILNRRDAARHRHELHAADAREYQIEHIEALV